MNLTRLVALSLLAGKPRHGHEIRRLTELTAAGRWGGVSMRSLPRELRLLDQEGLIVIVRTEQVGRRPARMVYEITDQGRQELHILREDAMSAVYQDADPLSVALVFAETADHEEILPWLRRRRDTLAAELRALVAERERLQAHGYLTLLQAAAMGRGEVMMCADLTWHDELVDTLDHQEPTIPTP